MSKRIHSEANQLPLDYANDFCNAHGLGFDFEKINKLRNVGLIDSSLETSATKRGLIIELLESRGMWEEFLTSCWPYGRDKQAWRISVNREHARRFKNLTRYS